MLKWVKISTFAYKEPDCKNTVFNPPFILTAINIINTLVDQYTWLRSGRHRDGHKLRAVSHVAPRTCVAGKRSIRVNFQMDSRGRNRKKRDKSTLSRLFDWTWAFTETLVSKKTSKTNFAKMCSMSNKFKQKDTNSWFHNGTYLTEIKGCRNAGRKDQAEQVFQILRPKLWPPVNMQNHF